MTSYRIFESGGTVTNGPATAASYSGAFQAGVVFGVTSVSWLEGYWWWVCASGGQPTAPQKFCLWQMYGSGQGSLIASSVVTSGTLKAGWNWVPLPKPIPLSIANTPSQPAGDGAAVYIATTGFTGPFPITSGTFATNGIINGPLVAYSDGTGTLKSPQIGGGLSQGEFAEVSDPTLTPPNNNSAGSSNFWVDVQVSDSAPSGYTGSYRLWPNMPSLYHVDPPDSDTLEQTMGTMFVLSEPCTLNAVWFYSPSWATIIPAGLPTQSQVWDATTGKIVAQNTTAKWSGATGSGWVSDSYASQDITLPAGTYISTIYYPGYGNGVSPQQGFYAENKGYFGQNYVANGATTVGPGYKGITNGPLSSPALTSAYDFPNLGNTCYIVNSQVSGSPSGPLFPTNWDDQSDYKAGTGYGDDGETRWVDVEVTPGGSTTPPPPPAKSSGIPLTFFP
jgi:hypothetical protein